MNNYIWQLREWDKLTGQLWLKNRMPQETDIAFII